MASTTTPDSARKTPAAFLPEGEGVAVALALLEGALEVELVVLLLPLPLEEPLPTRAESWGSLSKLAEMVAFTQVLGGFGEEPETKLTMEHCG